jgi:hypothetical protein
MPMLMNTTLGLFALSAGFGTWTFFDPLATMRINEYPIPDDAATRKVVGSMVRIHGARNVRYGLAGFVLWFYGNPRLLGAYLLAGAVAPLADAFVSWELIGRGMGRHLVFFAPMVGVGVSLLGWL